MVSIAMIGTEGSGKTVLITALAKKYGNLQQEASVFMEPLTGKTVKYIEKTWSILQNGDWPQSTTPGELFDLQWKLKFEQNLAAELRLVDMAGQDLRVLYGQEQVNTLDNLPPNIKTLFETLSSYIQNADIVLLLINLKDFVGESNLDRKIENEWTIKYVIDTLQKSDKGHHFCIVFTQADLYEEYFQNPDSLEETAKQYLTILYGSYLAQNQFPILAVSAVADTTIDRNSQRRIPKQNFRSQGFQDLMSYLSSASKSILEYEADQLAMAEKEKADQLAAIKLEAKKKADKIRSDETIQVLMKTFGWFVGICICIFLIYTCQEYNKKEQALKEQALREQALREYHTVRYDWDITYGTFNDDITLINRSKCRLKDITFNLELTKPNGIKLYKTLYLSSLSSGSSHTWVDAVSVPRGTRGTSTIKCDTE